MFLRSRLGKLIQPLQPSDLSAPELVIEKLHFLQISKRDIEQMRKLEKLIDEHAEEITRRHYESLSNNRGLQNIIDRHSTLERLTATFSGYLKSLPHIELNEEYIRTRLHIGVVHSRIQLSPEWYIGSYTRIYEFFIPLILKEFNRADAAEILLAFNRVLTLDSQLVLEAYNRANEFRDIETNSLIIEEIIQLDKVKPCWKPCRKRSAMLKM